jgi:hypothetical protein
METTESRMKRGSNRTEDNAGLGHQWEMENSTNSTNLSTNGHNWRSKTQIDSTANVMDLREAAAGDSPKRKSESF